MTIEECETHGQRDSCMRNKLKEYKEGSCTEGEVMRDVWGLVVICLDKHQEEVEQRYIQSNNTNQHVEIHQGG